MTHFYLTDPHGRDQDRGKRKGDRQQLAQGDYGLGLAGPSEGIAAAGSLEGYAARGPYPDYGLTSSAIVARSAAAGGPYGIGELTSSAVEKQSFAAEGPYQYGDLASSAVVAQSALAPLQHIAAPYGLGVPRPDRSRFGRPLRLIHVGPCFSRGGAEQQLLDLARFLDPRVVRFERCIVTNPKLIDPAVVEEMPAPVEIGGLGAIRRAARECDVLLCWGMPMNDWLRDVRPSLCVFLAHGESTWTQTLVRRSARAVDHVIAVSQRVKDKVCGRVPATVIFNGVDSARLGRTRPREQVRRSLGFDENDFVLGYVGRFSPEKRADLVIKATAALPPQFKALLVGWGPKRDQLLELAKRCIPGRFAFTFADRYLGDYYQALDVLCLLSEYEGFALVVLEAMMCDRPVVATPVGSVPEAIVDRVSGLVVRGEVNSICGAVRLLHQYPDWASGVAREGKRFAEKHGHAWRMARQYEQLLHRLWAEKQSNRKDQS